MIKNEEFPQCEAIESGEAERKKNQVLCSLNSCPYYPGLERERVGGINENYLFVCKTDVRIIKRGHPYFTKEFRTKSIPERSLYAVTEQF